VIEVYRDAEVHAAHMASDRVRESLPKLVALVHGKFDIRQHGSEGSAPARLTMKS
jgi:quinol monooxygenase YgiN